MRHPHPDQPVAVDLRRQLPGGLEGLGRQRCQQRLLDAEVLADGADPVLQAPVVLCPVDGRDSLVELGQRGDLRDVD
jgi:hypothetical protein